MIKNILLIVIFSFIGLVLVEASLYLFGPYKTLTTKKLQPSEAIYERPTNFIQKQPHPDLDLVVENYFDIDGVKNYSNISTSKKKNIIGFFGDSMTENINIDQKFEFTNVLNNVSKDFNLVNYGIGGYNLEQSFIRYQKYQNHDLKYVIFFMMPGDHFERNLIRFEDDNLPLITKPDINIFFHLLGKLNITYLLIDTYFNFRFIFQNYHQTGIDNYPSLYANKIYSEFYSNHKRSEGNFGKILTYFNKSNAELGRKFILILYPNKKMIKYVKERLKSNIDNIDYYIIDKKLLDKNLQFKNDPHWNELGNLYFADNLSNILKNYGIEFNNINLKKYKKNINEFYIKNES